VAQCSIEFRTDTTTQKGVVKKRIVPVVSVNGNSGGIKDVCSGGMESAIELAVDLAVGEVIARRTGASPQWLVLDEAFDGFDTIVKESCLEILQKYASSKLVVVVSHIPEFKEFFSQHLTVVYENGKSRIENA
jgi:DNA repair exonuclease SbcCD ATPase subunit